MSLPPPGPGSERLHCFCLELGHGGQGRSGFLPPAGFWVLCSGLSLHQLLSVVEATAFVLGKLAEARGEAAPGNLGVQRGWVGLGKVAGKMLVSRQQVLGNWLALGLALHQPGSPKRTKPRQLVHQPLSWCLARRRHLSELGVPEK